MNFFVLDNTFNSRSEGLRTTALPIIPTSQRIVNNIPVDGREGTLTNLRGWEDLPIRIMTGLIGKNLYNRFRNMLPHIQNAKTLYFSGDSDVYFKVKSTRVDVLERRLQSLYEFSILFNCLPFRYIRNVPPITLTASGTVVNIGTVFSRPKITVYGTGSGRTLTINGRQIVLNILQGSLTVDSELMNCHFGNVAQNTQMQGDFPVLEVGLNTITLGTGITSVVIEPRWRHL
jgi:phage-related protein